MKCINLLSCKQALQEFHYSKLWFTSEDWRTLVYIPWLPYRWQYQVFHVIYRWIILLYFIGWLAASGVQFSDSGGRYLIFLTNWAIISFVFYLLVAALSVTAKFLTVHCCNESQPDAVRTPDYQFKKPQGCCGYKSNKLVWYQMIHWASFSMFAEIALIVSVLYWVVLYDPNSPADALDGVNLNTHLINGVISLIDVFFFGVPVNFLHFIYPASYGAFYAGFSGIYWSANGTNPIDGGRYIYQLLDYGSNPSIASLIVFLVVLLYIPFMHLVFYSVHLGRFWLVYIIFDRRKVSCWGEQPIFEKHENTQENISTV